MKASTTPERTDSPSRRLKSFTGTSPCERSQKRLTALGWTLLPIPVPDQADAANLADFIAVRIGDPPTLIRACRVGVAASEARRLAASRFIALWCRSGGRCALQTWGHDPDIQGVWTLDEKEIVPISP